ncbi:MAG: hypothetical protein O7H41_20020 [Planctomycetota bacterium]|nr:hypothetical protein [Planctomycetota bacterium]
MIRTFFTLLGRQWLTAWKSREGYAMRSAYAGVLLLGGVAFLAYLAIGFQKGLGALADAVRAFHYLFSLGQFLVVTFLATIVFTRTLLREKEADTLDLLIISPLRRFQILLGKAVGDYLAVLAVLAAGFPILSFFMIFGGVRPVEVLSAHFILAGELAIVAGICIFLTVFLSNFYSVILITWTIVFGHLIMSSFGPRLIPSASAVWDALARVNLWVILEREVATVTLRLESSIATAAAGIATLVVCCLAGSLFLDRHNALRRESAKRSGLRGMLDSFERWLGSARILDLIFPRIGRNRLSLLGRELSIHDDYRFRFIWLLYFLAYAGFVADLHLVYPPLHRDAHLGLMVGTTIIVFILMILRTSLMAFSAKRDRTYEVLISADVEPEKIIQAAMAGRILRSAYLLAPILIHYVAILIQYPPNYWLVLNVIFNSTATILLTPVGVILGLFSGILLSLSASLSSRTAVGALISSMIRGVIGGIAVAVLASLSIATCVLSVPIVILTLLWVYARMTLQFRRRVLPA